MGEAATHPPRPLEYAGPVPPERPLRLWVWFGFMAALVALEGFQPRLTPPGWPTDLDYLLMLLLPIGAVVMATVTSLPGWSIGLYGLLGACTFLQGQFGDNRLHYRFATPAGVQEFLWHWCVFILGAWAMCRGAVVLRRRRSAVIGDSSAAGNVDRR